MVCVGCFKKTYQVRIRSDQLKNQTDKTVEEWVLALRIAGFSEVQKDLISNVAFLHFLLEESAASFFHQYKNTGLTISNNVIGVVPVLGEGYLPIRYNMPITPATGNTSSAEAAPTITEPAWRVSAKRAIIEIDEEIERLKRRRYYLQLSLD